MANMPASSKGCPRCNASSKVWGRRKVVTIRSDEDTVVIKNLNDQIEDKERELRAKQDEVDECKAKFKKELEEKKKLQQEYDRLLSSKSDAGQKLVKVNEMVERLRAEKKKKTEQLEKVQRTMNIMEDKMRNLEIRASEVEKAELTLDSTRRTLECTVHECRMKDTEIKKLTLQNEESKRSIESHREAIANMERKIEDLKLQVRCELRKNDTIEKNLETIPHLKEDLVDKDRRIRHLEKEMADKTALTISARKAVREYKDKLREVEHKVESVKELEVELELAQCEVETLKKLMLGKDLLVLQKCHALNLAKEVIDSLHTSTVDPVKLDKIRMVLERLCIQNIDTAQGFENGHLVSPTPKTVMTDRSPVSRGRPVQARPSTSPHMNDSNKENMININHPPFSMDSTLRCSVSPQPDTKPARPRTSHLHRTSSFKELPHFRNRSAVTRSTFHGATTNGVDSRTNNNRLFRTESRNNSSRLQPSLDSGLGRCGDKPARGKSAAVRYHSDTDSDQGSSVQDNLELLHRLSHEQRVTASNMSATERDEILMEAINIGDRISVTVPQKPPRYGRKKLKPITYNGLVRYKGRLDNDYYDPKMYVGVKLDEPIGECDGTYKGKRYMFTPAQQGHFFKIRDITSVLDIQSGQYLPLGKMMILHMVKKSQTPAANDTDHQLDNSISPVSAS